MAYAATATRSDFPPVSPLRRNAKFIAAGVVIALAVAYLIVAGLQSSSVYFLTVGELQARGSSAQSQLIRVSGNLVPGSLMRESNGLAVRFSIADPSGGTSALPVMYRGGQVPDIIGDNIEIVTEGKLDNQGTFQANTVLAKCPSRLENAPPVEHDYTAAATG